MPSSAEAETYLRRALELGARGRRLAPPNPSVGAVLVRDGKIVGEGWTQAPGGHHAEIEALRDAATAARGATAYVTLEPCSHFGRTPPCADALIEAGVVRVVACHRDPNPRVAGGGFQRLEQAGIEVESGLLVEEAVKLHFPFLISQLQGRPAVTLKWAMSLDGRIATVSGESQWLSSPEARQWALGLREEHGAILVGSGTALADDPRLNRRLGQAPGPILRAVMDRRLRLAPSARLFDEDGPVVIYTESQDAEAKRVLEARGAIVVSTEAGQMGPATVLADLHQRNVTSLLVEGGGEIHGAFVEASLFDRIAVDCAALLLGGDRAPGPVRGCGIAALAAAPRVDQLRATQYGPDWVLEGFRHGCLQELCRNVAE
ncbi:MAG: bifunctional diaminohydroxyphosphoribosylaminopyrimidine deaminase/5-amino-6-(5-phosphoribosylamino)uracil reductase RibD [Acidobacteriota bacterium]